MAAYSFLEALLRLPAVCQPLVSPDGKLVAWSWFHKADRANIYLVAADGSTRPMPLTDSCEDMFVVSWDADGKSLIVECCVDGNERMRLYELDVESGKLTLLTDEHPQYFLRGGTRSPNKRWLVYGANFDFATGTALDVSAVYRQDLKTGERKLLALPKRSPENGRNAPSLNAQGTHVLYFRAEDHMAAQQVWLVDIHGNRDRKILDFPQGKVTACWMPDGKRILFVAESGHYRKVGLFHRRTNAIKWLVNDPQRNIEHAWAPPGSDYVAVLEVKNAHEHCFLLDVNTLREVHLVPSQTGGTLIPLAPVVHETCTGGRKPAVCGTWLGVFYDSRRPADLVSFRLPQAGCLTGLTALPEGTSCVKTRSLTKHRRREVRRRHLAKAEDFFWQSADGLNMHGFLYRAVKPAGTVVIVHGGPRDRCEARFDAKVQYLVSQGFNVFQPNYRGSTGYGLRFQDLIKIEGWGGIEQDDIRSGIEALIKAGIAKPGKVGMTGTSYGGYSSWLAIVRLSTRLVAAAAPICGMTDLVVDYETTRPDLRSLSEEMMGGSPSQLPDKYRERSPIHRVAEIKGKLLIVQGGQDPNVTPENVRQVCKALKQAGIRYQLLEFPNEGHGICKPENEAMLFMSLSSFFRQAFGC
ncbi:MAG TPA: prolyl oligopeptidase family serine peptidase [Candidatus Obscuribacterales bacterium]